MNQLDRPNISGIERLGSGLGGGALIGAGITRGGWTGRLLLRPAPGGRGTEVPLELTDNSNPNAEVADKFYGYATAGLFGYSHLTGGYAGGQAEYVRVPYAEVDCFKVPDGVSDDQALFLGDIFPTGFMAAENCDIQPGHVIAVLGCGPVGPLWPRTRRAARIAGRSRVRT